MTKDYTKEELWRLYLKLPEELREALFSTEVSDDIDSICARHHTGQYVSQITKEVSNVLFGVTTPESFQKQLEDIGIEQSTAKDMAVEINRFVFYPVKSALEQLHNIDVTPKNKEDAEFTKEEIAAQEPIADKKTEEAKGLDTYREPVE